MKNFCIIWYDCGKMVYKIHLTTLENAKNLLTKKQKVFPAARMIQENE